MKNPEKKYKFIQRRRDSPCNACGEPTDTAVAAAGKSMAIHKPCAQSARGTEEIGMFLRRVGAWTWDEISNGAGNEAV